jgi:hypothetical protein
MRMRGGSDSGLLTPNALCPETSMSGEITEWIEKQDDKSG